MQFEMSINAYAYDVQNSDASMYILTQRFWLLVAASGWQLPLSFGMPTTAAVSTGHSVVRKLSDCCTSRI
ncbi:MAG: hypothetical protein ACLGIY_02085 [Betaproteobacteria bacterium]